MDQRLSADEIEELLGAYALDAIDDDERDQIEAFLRRSPRPAALTVEMQQAATFLATSVAAPTGLWRRIEQALEDDAPPLQLSIATNAASPNRERWPRTRSRRRVLTAGIAAAAIVVPGFLAAKVLQQQQQIDDVSGRLARRAGIARLAVWASHEPNARTVRLVSEGGQFEADVVYLRDGQGYLVTDNLERLPSGRTYQLWVLVGDRNEPTAISAGVLGPDPKTTAFMVRGRVVGFMITEEPVPGVPVPTATPLLQGGVV